MDSIKTPEEKHDSPLKAIRKKCLNCTNGSSQEIRLCPIHDCSLYPYRFGRNSYRSPMPEDKRRELAARLHPQEGKA